MPAVKQKNLNRQKLLEQQDDDFTAFKRQIRPFQFYQQACVAYRVMGMGDKAAMTTKV